MRGAPAIAIVGCLSVAIELHSARISAPTVAELLEIVRAKLDYLVTARPTAVNMSKSRDEFVDKIKEFGSITDVAIVKLKLVHIVCRSLADSSFSPVEFQID